jgi:Tfp pilus assembly pilus retraction ATPase PilT
MPGYFLNGYSIPDLLKLLVVERGESIRLEVGYEPSLTIKGKDFEIEGPVVEEEAAEELLRTVASTREMRIFRQRGTIDIIHTFRDSRFLVRAVRAFSDFRLELHALKS